jgi:hypothetical protein
VYRASKSFPKTYQPSPKNAKAKVLDVGPGREILAFDKSEDWWKLAELPVGVTDFLYVSVDGGQSRGILLIPWFQLPE